MRRGEEERKRSAEEANQMPCRKTSEKEQHEEQEAYMVQPLRGAEEQSGEDKVMNV